MDRAIKNGIVYVEAPRSDEVAEGIPSDVTEQQAATQERKQGGKGIAPGSKVVPSMGGRAHKGSTRLTHRINEKLPVDDKLKARARFMRKRTCTDLAQTVGGGSCGLIASALVLIASEDMAMRAAAVEAGDVELAQKLGVSVRGHLLSARDVAAKDAEARKTVGDPHATPVGFEVVEAKA